MVDSDFFMSGFNEVAPERAHRFAAEHGLRVVDDNAGFGSDAHLFATGRHSYLKAFERPFRYFRERDVYLRLRRYRVIEIEDHRVPQLVALDDRLGVIEISTVSRPFILDFAKARLDQPLETVWPEHVMEERWRFWQECFEPEQWPQVLAIFGTLGRRYGVWLEDLHPGNIAFA